MALTRRQSVTIARKRRPLRRRLCADWGRRSTGQTAWAKAHGRPCKLRRTAMRLCHPYSSKLSTQSWALVSALQIPIAI